MSVEQASGWWFKREFGFDRPPPAGAGETMLRAVLICANGDGTLAPSERDWVMGLAAMHAVEPKFLERLGQDPATDDIEKVVRDDAMVSDFGRRALVYYALCAAGADGELHPDEIAMIRRMASVLGVERDVVDQLISLVELEDGLRTMRMKLLAPEPPPF